MNNVSCEVTNISFQNRKHPWIYENISEEKFCWCIARVHLSHEITSNGLSQSVSADQKINSLLRQVCGIFCEYTRINGNVHNYVIRALYTVMVW